MQRLKEMEQEMDLSPEIDGLVHVIDEQFDPTTNSLDFSNYRLRAMPIAPVLRAIHRSRYFTEIQELKLNRNRLFGVLQRDPLPPNLKHLDISENDLYSVGCSFLSILPKSLQEFYAQNNHFSDNELFSWNVLPPKMRILSLRQNDFSGQIQWAMLSRLKVLIVSGRVADRSMIDKPTYWVDATRVKGLRKYLLMDNGLEIVENTAIFVNNAADGLVI